MGHIVSENEVSIDPAKVEAVVRWEKLNTVTEIMSFLGITRYYCRFSQGFLEHCDTTHSTD